MPHAGLFLPLLANPDLQTVARRHHPARRRQIYRYGCCSFQFRIGTRRHLVAALLRFLLFRTPALLLSPLRIGVPALIAVGVRGLGYLAGQALPIVLRRLCLDPG